MQISPFANMRCKISSSTKMSDDKNNKFKEYNSRYDLALKDKIDMFAIIKNKRYIFSVEFIMMLLVD